MANCSVFNLTSANLGFFNNLPLLSRVRSAFVEYLIHHKFPEFFWIYHYQ